MYPSTITPDSPVPPLVGTGRVLADARDSRRFPEAVRDV